MKRSDEIDSIGISLVASLPRPLRLTILRPGGRYLHRFRTGGEGPGMGDWGRPHHLVLGYILLTA